MLDTIYNSIKAQSKPQNDLHVPTLSVRFGFELPSWQIPQWRGAMAEAAGWKNTHFHNHRLVEHHSDSVPPTAAVTQRQGYHYRYPLIQYRSWQRQAAIWAIGEGAEQLRQFLLHAPAELSVNGKPASLAMVDFREQTAILRVTESPREYHLREWLPFNSANYERWQATKGVIKRTALLEQILVGQILNFATGVGWELPQRLEVELLDLSPPRSRRYLGTERVAFHITFQANVQLPSGIALGKGVSHGFGLVL